MCELSFSLLEKFSKFENLTLENIGGGADAPPCRRMLSWEVESNCKSKHCALYILECLDAINLSQVLITSNNKSMKSVPVIEGLLSYRSDHKKLYLREKSRWNALGTQDEVWFHLYIWEFHFASSTLKVNKVPFVFRLWGHPNFKIAPWNKL